eukprot:1622406-Rhodomonas_salina.1
MLGLCLRQRTPPDGIAYHGGARAIFTASQLSDFGARGLSKTLAMNTEISSRSAYSFVATCKQTTRSRRRLRPPPLPGSVDVPAGHTVRLRKRLYGLSDAAYRYHKTFSYWMLGYGCEALEPDHTMFKTLESTEL